MPVEVRQMLARPIPGYEPINETRFQACEDGWTAYRNGQPLTACPYGTVRTLDIHAEPDDQIALWCQGWLDARDSAEADAAYEDGVRLAAADMVCRVERYESLRLQYEHLSGWTDGLLTVALGCDRYGELRWGGSL
ncbi:MAG: hypothetical protein RLO53_13920 [Salinisphaeraceae bacterium]